MDARGSAHDNPSLSTALPKRPAAAAVEFLKGLAQAAKVIALYKASHPIAASALGEAYKAFLQLVEQLQQPQVHLTLAEDQWLINAAVVAQTTQVPELLKALFHGHNLHTLSLDSDVRLYELSALCELAAIPPRSAQEAFPSDYLAQKGVRRIRINQETYTKARAAASPAARPKTKAPKPAAEPPPARPQPRPTASRSFGTLLKALVESAVKDPDERANVYAEALDMVRQALDRHVEQSTAALKLEKQRILQEQARAERVLSTVAQGKVVVDREGNVLMMNPEAEAISGKRLVEVAGRPIADSISGKDQMLAMASDLEIDPRKRLEKDIRVIAEGEVERALKKSIALVQDEAGRLVGTYAVLPDVAKFKEAQRMQEEFVSRMTHELRAPLTAICSALELIQEIGGPKLGPQETKFLSICSKNSQRLGEMINEILDFSKLDSGQMSVSLSRCEVDPLLQESVDGLAPWAKSKGIALRALREQDLPEVMADRHRAVQIITNLVSNAIKSTPDGGSITVEAGLGQGQHAGSVIFSVSDTGCGIAPQDLKRIFEKFVQIGGPDSYREGVGLGLSIVHELVGLHHGEVWAESQLGQGCTFRFTLPTAAEAASVQPTAAPGYSQAQGAATWNSMTS